jgi:hypothetical protein
MTTSIECRNCTFYPSKFLNVFLKERPAIICCSKQQVVEILITSSLSHSSKWMKSSPCPEFKKSFEARMKEAIEKGKE